MAKKIVINGPGPAQALEVKFLQDLADAVNEANAPIESSPSGFITEVISSPGKKIIKFNPDQLGGGKKLGTGGNGYNVQVTGVLNGAPAYGVALFTTPPTLLPPGSS